MMEAVHLKKDNRSYISTGNDACVLSVITYIEIKDFFIRIPEVRLNWLLKKCMIGGLAYMLIISIIIMEKIIPFFRKLFF